jgi:hypothetical protein
MEQVILFDSIAQSASSTEKPRKPTTEEVLGRHIKLNNKELHNVLSLPNFFSIIIRRKIRVLVG